MCCALCRKCVPLNANSRRCGGCRNAFGTLARQALRENQQEYWLNVCRDNEEMNKLVARYLSSRVKHAKHPLNLTSYIKEYLATNNANAGGVMMWEGYFVQFAQTAKGGFYSEVEATQRWHEMRRDPAVNKDSLGPAKAPTRC